LIRQRHALLVILGRRQRPKQELNAARTKKGIGRRIGHALRRV
jgi:hypothetical protein